MRRAIFDHVIDVIADAVARRVMVEAEERAAMCRRACSRSRPAKSL